MKNYPALAAMVMAALAMFSGIARGEDSGARLATLLFADASAGALPGGGGKPPDAGERIVKKREPRKGFRMRLEGLGQVRFTAVENDKYVKESGETGYVDHMAVERVWLKAKMQDVPDTREAKWNLVLIFDVTADENELVDFFVWYKAMRYIEVQAGQMRLPFGWQMRRSPEELTTAKYSQVVEALFGEFRDQGVIACGDFGRDDFYYQLGFFNGDGPGTWGDEPYGATCVRLGWQPVIKKKKRRIHERVNVGLSYYLGRYGTPDGMGKRVRIGLDFRILYGNTLFQGEYITNATSTDEDDGGTEGDVSGAFVELGYYLLSERNFLPVVRFDFLDREDDPLGRRTVISLGFNYSPKDYISFQFFYEIHDEEKKQENEGSGSILRNDEFIAQVNVEF